MDAQGLRFPSFLGARAPAGTSRRLSWPLLVAVYVYLLTLYQGNFLQLLLVDGDTYWHVAAGRWILQNGVVPIADPFSHTMAGTPWIAHEWLSEVLLALARDHGGWDAVVALTGFAFALSAGLLMHALLRWMPPVRALMLTVLAVLLTVSHLLARPHMLALPLMMAWAIGLVRARDEDRAPSLLLLPVMVAWANMHLGFTLGVALTGWFALEAAVQAWGTPAFRRVVGGWTLFGVLTVACSLLTPHGLRGFDFTWQVLVRNEYALSRISEWASPNFHAFQPLQVWLLGGLAVVLHQGLKLPLFRLVLLLGLLHLSLKHVRYVELLGLLGPLVIAKPFGEQWARMAGDQAQARRGWATPVGKRGIVAACVLAVVAPMLLARIQPASPPAFAAPTAAIEAARTAGVAGSRVLNAYGWGGYLIYAGIPPAIDGRAEMYGDPFCKQYFDAINLQQSGGLERLLDRHAIGWTLLAPDTPAVAYLDRLPGWRRIHTDAGAVVHARVAP